MNTWKNRMTLIVFILSIVSIILSCSSTPKSEGEKIIDNLPDYDIVLITPQKTTIEFSVDEYKELIKHQNDSIRQLLLYGKYDQLEKIEKTGFLKQVSSKSIVGRAKLIKILVREMCD